MLLTNNLSFKRGSKTIFHNINISLSPKKIIQIKGRNGIGKTTLIKILSNILVPSTGEIYWNGKNIKKDSHLFFKNFTYIMDTNTSKIDMTIYENILFWKKLFLSSISDQMIESLLNLLQLNIYKNVMVKYLSYGEIRKLELCRLMIEQKKLWILDEPYSGLDELTTNIFNETLINHSQNGGMVIFSSHFYPPITSIEDLPLEHYANI